MTLAPPSRSSRALAAFRAFAAKGNALELAFAVVVGEAFSKVVDSLVKDVLMPVIGMVGSADFSNYYLPLSTAVTATNLADAQKQGPVLAWGEFVTDAVNFLIVAGALFVIAKAVDRLKLRKASPNRAPAAAMTREEVLLTQIRDLLARDRTR